MEQLIEKYAMQCTSWPYWRDMVEGSSTPSAFITAWPDHITDDQKAFWRTFVTNMVTDLQPNLTLVDSSKLDQILTILNK